MKRLIFFSLLSLGLFVPATRVQAVNVRNERIANEKAAQKLAIWHATATGLGAASLYLKRCPGQTKQDVNNAAIVGLGVGSLVGLSFYTAAQKDQLTGIHTIAAVGAALCAPVYHVVAGILTLAIIDPFLS